MTGHCSSTSTEGYADDLRVNTTQNFNETLKQWTGIFNYTFTPTQVLAETPSAAYTKYIYGDNVVGIFGEGIGHTVPVMGDQDLAWFGIS